MYPLDPIHLTEEVELDFKLVLKIFEQRQWKSAKEDVVKKWEGWMRPELFSHPTFFCSRLGFVTDPVTCLHRRTRLQHPTHQTCIDCPLGDKLASRTCVGSHGQHQYCSVCPSANGCKSVTDLTKNPMQVISLRVQPGALPAEENQLAKKTAAPNKKKNKDVEDEDEDEDIETEEEVEEEEDEEEEADEDDDEDEDEDEAPAPKKKGKKGKGNAGNLVPREPVKVSKDVLSKVSPEVKKLLLKREKTTDKGELRKIRAQLRSAGFRLSSLSSENPQIEKKVKTDNEKKKAKKVVEADEDDE